MSNALAIAGVTAVLKNLLDNALIDSPASTAVGDPVSVKTMAPDRARSAQNGQAEPTQLNLFMYHVTPNPGWSNVGLPSRNGNGERLTNPPLALDLHYLLTAYGANDFEAEILLGYAMQVLHETPVLARGAIRKALEPPSPIEADVLPGDVLPTEMEKLAASALAEQAELIKLTLQPMSTEEMSKLWTAFQTNYRPSAAYHASVVLIESQRQAQSPLPVLTRGVIVQPHLLPPFPTLQKVTPPNQQPAVRMGETLALSGHHLGGNNVVARFMHVRSSQTLQLPASDTTPARFQVQIPADPAPEPIPADSPEHSDNWQAGLYSVVAVVQPTGQTERTTNELPVALAPRIIPDPVTDDLVRVSTAGNEITLEVKCSPKVWKAQRATLVVGDREISAEEVTEEKTDTLTFKSSSFPKGQQWVRLRVDGVDSLLIDRSGPAPAFDASQQVTIT